MTQLYTTINSSDVARKLIRTAPTFLLLIALEACSERPNERLDNVDRAEFQELLDRVIEIESAEKAPETPVMVKLDEVA